MTAGVYGLVAGIVKLDDLGLALQRCQGKGWIAGLLRRVGSLLLQAAPFLMKALSVVGTIAMFMVGGGILIHGIAPAHSLVEGLHPLLAPVPFIGGFLADALSWLAGILLGIVSGAMVFIGVTYYRKRSARIKKEEA
jgi:predicted DNA repair protein MutK